MTKDRLLVIGGSAGSLQVIVAVLRITLVSTFVIFLGCPQFSGPLKVSAHRLEPSKRVNVGRGLRYDSGILVSAVVQVVIDQPF